jgi:hypothetical protein
MYCTVCGVIFSQKDSASHMNASATLPNGRRIKENGGGTVVVRATQVRTHFLLHE